MMSLYGENGIYELIELAKKYNWQIYDSGIDGMIDIENPENNGYKSHQSYISQIMKKYFPILIVLIVPLFSFGQLPKLTSTK